MHATPVQPRNHSLERQGRVAAIVLALVMGCLAAYGFAAGLVVVPTSNGRIILNGAAAYWAAAGQVLLALGLASVPYCRPRLAPATILCAAGFSLGALLVWVGTLLA